MVDRRPFSMVPVLASLGWVLLGCPVDTSDIDPMEHQPKFKAYRTTDFYPDGRTMRQPPTDTVALEHDFGNPVGPMPDGGVPVLSEKIPVPVDEALVNLGQRKFDQMCAVCHGMLANGESVVARKMSIRPPPSLLTEAYRKKSDGYIFGVITNGFGYMNPYREQLTSHERWAVVSYVRALQLSQNVAVSTLTPQEVQLVNAPPKPAGEEEEGGAESETSEGTRHE
jgi:mono/diheme cytochrome c family protein